MNSDYMAHQSNEAQRCLNEKVYDTPVERMLWRHEHVEIRRQQSWHTLQNAAILILIGILLVFSARCVYRFAARGHSRQPRTLDGNLNELKSELNLSPVDENEDEHIAEFHEYIHRFDKKYSSIKEHWRRYLIFTKNRRELEIVRRQSNNTIFGMSEFSDMDDSELTSLLIPHSYSEPGLPQDLPHFDTAPAWPQTVKRPIQFDWRSRGAVTGIKNQGSCGSCYAFSVTAVVESLNVIAGGKRTKLSEQELLDCDRQQMGCFGGYRPTSFRFVKQTGLVEEEFYSYTGTVGSCRLPTINKTRVFIDEMYGFDRNEDDMADWVATKGPISVGLNVIKEMFEYKGGVFDPSPEDCAQRSLGSHALAIVGYGQMNGEDYWLMKNSWGPAWGAAGYLRMKRRVNSCGLANSAFGALIKRQ
ncbi:hypothetical protein M3Y96_00245900 [Aphelenchoides besseyi]|nr:hypothetical protein M3Y96_00245900 [Aphelenchoides besseyi]